MKKPKYSVELAKPVRQHQGELHADKAKLRKVMMKKLDQLISSVLQHSLFRVHYCMRSGQAIFMVLEKETNLDVDGAKFSEL